MSKSEGAGWRDYRYRWKWWIKGLDEGLAIVKNWFPWQPNINKYAIWVKKHSFYILNETHFELI